MKPLITTPAIALLAGVLVLGLPACAGPKIDPAVADASNPAPVKAFEDKLSAVARSLPGEPGYKRIPLDSKEDQQWLTTQAFLLWTRRSPRPTSSPRVRSASRATRPRSKPWPTA